MPRAIKWAFGLALAVAGVALLSRPALAEGACDFLVPEVCSSSYMTICFPEYPGGPTICDTHRVDIIGRAQNEM
jgi:hypothetical protein